MANPTIILSDRYTLPQSWTLAVAEKAGAYQTVPGTGLQIVGPNMTIERLNDLLVPTGTFVDTTGTHELVDHTE